MTRIKKFLPALRYKKCGDGGGKLAEEDNDKLAEEDNDTAMEEEADNTELDSELLDIVHR